MLKCYWLLQLLRVYIDNEVAGTLKETLPLFCFLINSESAAVLNTVDTSPDLF